MIEPSAFAIAAVQHQHVRPFRQSEELVTELCIARVGDHLIGQAQPVTEGGQRFASVLHGEGLEREVVHRLLSARLSLQVAALIADVGVREVREGHLGHRFNQLLNARRAHDV